MSDEIRKLAEAVGADLPAHRSVLARFRAIEDRLDAIEGSRRADDRAAAEIARSEIMTAVTQIMPGAAHGGARASNDGASEA
jgi:hypothetical protein